MNTRVELKKRAQFVKKIRQFFDEQNLVEVQTPHLLSHPNTDVYIDSITATANNLGKYLHTSPELEMKKLLAEGSGDIYQICPVYRDNEQGAHNFNEFTLIEYYRLGFDIQALMDNIVLLLNYLGIGGTVRRYSYAEIFFKYAGFDILNSDLQALKKIAKTHHLSTDFAWIEDLQMLLFVHLIEPQIKNLPICFIYDYPEQQAALAKIKGQVAQRFELYIHGIEIANGYDELCDAPSYRQRFTKEINKRHALGKPGSGIDHEFLTYLQTPLPECSGVAIGFERLFALV